MQTPLLSAKDPDGPALDLSNLPLPKLMLLCNMVLQMTISIAHDKMLRLTIKVLASGMHVKSKRMCKMGKKCCSISTENDGRKSDPSLRRMPTGHDIL